MSQNVTKTASFRTKMTMLVTNEHWKVLIMIYWCGTCKNAETKYKVFFWMEIAVKKMHVDFTLDSKHQFLFNPAAQFQGLCLFSFVIPSVLYNVISNNSCWYSLHNNYSKRVLLDEKLITQKMTILITIWNKITLNFLMICWCGTETKYEVVLNEVWMIVLNEVLSDSSQIDACGFYPWFQASFFV